MNPLIKNIPSKKIVGVKIHTNLSENRTPSLWKNFMPRRKEIADPVTTGLISMQVYDTAPDFASYDPLLAFDRWAAVEVADFGKVPAGMETYTMKGGMYAVFLHKGGPQTGYETYNYIFTKWLPGSGYKLDHREHFELLGDKYRNDDPHSEEEIWIPVKPKNG
jgi:AraC family transcriptional regulator